MRDDAPQGVIVVWADTLRRDHLGAYGYARATSPQIDRLAAEGTLFDACVGQATWTKVAHTGDDDVALPRDQRRPAVLTIACRDAATTLAEVYRDAGYATVSFSSILFTGQMTNLHQGFDEVHESRGRSPTRNRARPRASTSIDSFRGSPPTSDVPFFVFLHVSDPHDPFKPYAAVRHAVERRHGADRGHERQMEAVKPFIADPLMKLFGMPSRAELRKAGFDPDAYTAFNEGWYDGSIRAMDAEIGRLMERLRSAGPRPEDARRLHRRPRRGVPRSWPELPRPERVRRADQLAADLPPTGIDHRRFARRRDGRDRSTSCRRSSR